MRTVDAITATVRVRARILEAVAGVERRRVEYGGREALLALEERGQT